MTDMDILIIILSFPAGYFVMASKSKLVSILLGMFQVTNALFHYSQDGNLASVLFGVIFSTVVFIILVPLYFRSLNATETAI